MACVSCRYVHPRDQICPYQLFEIPLYVKGSNRHLGNLLLRYHTQNTVLSEHILARYRARTSRFQRILTLSVISDNLYIVIIF
jgi:hypothetical protein